MKQSAIFAAVVAASCAFAAPLAESTEPFVSTIEERDLLPGLTTSINGDLKVALSSGDVNAIINSLEQQTNLTKTPSSSEAALKVIQAITASKPANLIEYVGLLLANGLTPEGAFAALTATTSGKAPGAGSNNRNRAPKKSVYRKVNSCDAPYSVPESTLRGAIYIPPTFTYGKKPPVILFPGTGSTGYTTYIGNMIPLLTSSKCDWADPVWINVPQLLLNDVQANAQFAAYAINYIASVTKRNVTLMAWSQGNLDFQWAFKYWPSTRKVVSDLVSISADFHGTILFNVIVPGGIANTPAVLQQQYNSRFVSTLRGNGGDSGYVPTTSIYSGFLDQIVQPQSGTNASAFLFDARKVGVTNYEVQKVCPGQPAGTIYTHEGVLYNPLALALLKDAMANPGPARISRIDLKSVCAQYLTPGLGLADFLKTSESILIAALGILTYTPKSSREPAIASYATRPLCNSR